MKEEKGHTFWHKSIKTEEHSQSSWAPKHKVWFQKNDDSKLGREEFAEMMSNKVMNTYSSDEENPKIRKVISRELAKQGKYLK